MIDLIVFSVGSNHYALNIENVQRIIQASELTSIPNAHELIDGMMSHEDGVIKVISFRKLIGLASYEEELKKLFTELKVSHQDWFDMLKDSITNDTPFTKAIDPSKCELGVWLNGFKSIDENITSSLSSLINNHKNLHSSAAEALSICKSDKDRAKEMFDNNISKIFYSTMSGVDTFINDVDRISNSLQKLIIYERDGKTFAVKVDAIEDIAHIEESMIMNIDEDSSNNSDFLELKGVLDIDGVLINIVKRIDIPS